MSAFICSDKHFQALAIFAVHRRFGGSRRVDPRYIDGLDGDKEYSERFSLSICRYSLSGEHQKRPGAIPQ